MANKVFANGLEVSCKVSSGKSIAAFPDPCWSPPSPPAGPIVIPYANTAYAKDLSNGSSSVFIGGKPIAQKDKSYFSKSTGNEAATRNFGQGVVTATIKGKAYFVSWSMNVMVEGYNVARHTDLMTHNHGAQPANTAVWPFLSSADSGGEIKEDGVEKCEYCGKNKHEFEGKLGSNAGNSQKLRANIIKRIEDHRWFIEGLSSPQAHHLICCEAVSNEEWYEYCQIFGYNINHKNNGVMLPNDMRLACRLHVPLHRGHHDLGMADGEPYPKKIKKELSEIAEEIKNGSYCDDPENLIDELNKFSEDILDKISKFEWTISYDGKDYASEGIGCAGARSLPAKRAIKTPAPCDRKHDELTQNGCDLGICESLKIGT